MSESSPPKVVVVTGAAGQDGYYLTERLLREGCTVIAVARQPAALESLANKSVHGGRIRAIPLDVLNASAVTNLVCRVKPDEIYNLAGISSVAASFAEPRLTWSTNVDAVVTLLEAVRLHSPESRLYQASSSEMFGYIPNGRVVHDEHSPLRPASPYAAAKAAAHLLCQSYRDNFGIKVGCGVMFNHESHRRPKGFLTRKIADHVRALSKGQMDTLPSIPPLELGNLKVRRDWGFAPDYVDGMILVLRQVDIRSERRAPERDIASSYRDYVLGSGEAKSVWQLVDRAFSLAGHDLVWQLEADDPCKWNAVFASSGQLAVTVNRAFLRPNDPAEIQADPRSVSRELGWNPHRDIDRFLSDMLFKEEN
jgi:GDPmannose 4,6-dehydratase